MENRTKSKGKGKKRKAVKQEIKNTNSEEIRSVESKLVPSFKKKKSSTKQVLNENKADEGGTQKKTEEVIEKNNDGPHTKNTDECLSNQESNSSDEISVPEPKICKEALGNDLNVILQNQDKQETNCTSDSKGQAIEERKIQDEPNIKFRTSSDDQKCEPTLHDYGSVENKLCSTMSVSGQKESITSAKTYGTTEITGDGSERSLSRDGVTNINLVTDITSQSPESLIIPPPSKGMLEELQNCLDDAKLTTDRLPDLLKNYASPKDITESVYSKFDGLSDPVCNTNSQPSEVQCADHSTSEQELLEGEVKDELHWKDAPCGVHIDQIVKSGSPPESSTKEPRQKRQCFSLTETTANCYDETTDKSATIPEKPEQFMMANTSSKEVTDAENRSDRDGDQSTLKKEQLMPNSQEKHEIQNLPSVISEQSSGVLITEINLDVTTQQQNDHHTMGKKEHKVSNSVDMDMDITDSQLCEAVNVEESSSQLKALQEVQKRHLEGRKIIHDLIVDLSYLNKLLLRTKREIETARRKRQAPAGNRKNNGNCFDQRRC